MYDMKEIFICFAFAAILSTSYAYQKKVRASEELPPQDLEALKVLGINEGRADYETYVGEKPCGGTYKNPDSGSQLGYNSLCLCLPGQECKTNEENEEHKISSRSVQNKVDEVEDPPATNSNSFNSKIDEKAAKPEEATVRYCSPITACAWTFLHQNSIEGTEYLKIANTYCVCQPYQTCSNILKHENENFWEFLCSNITE